MNPADQAQIEAAKFSAAMARRDAGNVMSSAAENAVRFTESAEKQLSYGAAILAKTGNLGETKNALPTSGIDVGTLDTPEVQQMRQQAIDLQKRIDAGGETKTVQGPGLGHGPDTYQVSNLNDLKKQLADLNDQLSLVGAPGGGVADIKNPDALLYASGSDLLTMVSTRDAMERDKRTLMRNAQTGAMTAIKTGKNYDKMADYAQAAANWNTWSTILGMGTSILQIAGGFGLKNPFVKASSGVGSVTRSA